MSTHKYKVGDIVTLKYPEKQGSMFIHTEFMKEAESSDLRVQEIMFSGNPRCVTLSGFPDYPQIVQKECLVLKKEEKQREKKKRKPVNHTLTPIKGAAGRHANEMIHFAKLGLTHTLKEIWKYELTHVSKEAVRRAVRRQANCGVRELIKAAEQNYRIINGVK